MLIRRGLHTDRRKMYSYYISILAQDCERGELYDVRHRLAAPGIRETNKRFERRWKVFQRGAWSLKTMRGREAGQN